MNKTEILHELKNLANIDKTIAYDMGRIVKLERRRTERLFTLCDLLLEYYPDTDDKKEEK